MNNCLTLALALVSVGAQAEVLTKVTICAAECNSEILGRLDHDTAQFGTLYVADATEANLGNTAVCLANAQKIDVLGSRLNDESAVSCTKALLGQFSRQRVTIDTKAVAADSEDGAFLKITRTK